MSIDELKLLVKDDIEQVTQLIQTHTQKELGIIEDLSNHIIRGGGKLLRPLLVLLASHACQYSGKDHLTLAMMVELFHTATLLHDDVVDESVLRRGQETAHEIWGSKASILVGDYLFTQSVQLTVSIENWSLMRLLASTSHQITCGELKQMLHKHNISLSIPEYLDVILSKTAVLFAASASIGAIIADKPDDIQQALYQYGLYVGNAFQLVDDALDYASTADVFGKNIGDDLAEGKATLPLLYAYQQGTEHQRLLIKQSLEQGTLTHLSDIKTAITETKAIEYTQQVASEQAEQAIQSISILPESPFKEGLKKLALFAVERDY